MPFYGSSIYSFGESRLPHVGRLMIYLRMRDIMIELIHTYWRESKTRFREYLAWPEEKKSDLNAIWAVYREINEVKERWVQDLLFVDENCTDDDLSFEISDNVQEVLELGREIDMKFGLYKTILEWAKEHPGEHDECLDFYLVREEN